jgi:hypothetical protein
MKPLSELLEAVEPKTSVYSVVKTEHLIMPSGKIDTSILIPAEDLVDCESYDKMKAIAIELAKGLEKQAGLFGDCGEFSMAGEALSRARSLLEGEK